MRNLRLKLMYNGQRYHGWQLQPYDITVQGTLEAAIKSVTGTNIRVHGCSRTDTGVHANEFFCNFHTESLISEKGFVNALNAKLPDDISVVNCKEMPASFHSRFDCIAKQYVYRIWNSPYKNPFEYGRAYHCKYPLDEELMNEAAAFFKGEHDFKAFCSSGSSVTDTIRNVCESRVTREGDIVLFIVTANGFLYNMVRIMVGTLLYVNEGKIQPSSIPQIILSGERKNAGITAHSEGLYLNRVYYPENKE